jgi:hypothetical protein
MQQTPVTVFEPLINNVDNTFQQAINIYQHNPEPLIPAPLLQDDLQSKIDELLLQRQKEIMIDKDATTPTGKNLQFLQTISTQLGLINTVVNDQRKIVQKIAP